MNAKESSTLPRYSDHDLKEFEEIISQKLAVLRQDFAYIHDTLTKRHDAGAENNSNKPLEDGADTAEKESLNQQAARLKKFINDLELALVRIKNGTYGICVDSGVLIPKERLRVVPHTRQTIEAKKARL